MKSNKLDNNNGLTSTYIVSPNQTIYDVAIDTHGTIDGVTDLLVNNGWLSVDETLYPGMKIVYTSGETIDEHVTSQLDASAIVPVNPRRDIYPKINVSGKIIDIFTDTDSFMFQCYKNKGVEIYVDWGDNTPIEKISANETLIYHQFEIDDNVALTSKVRFYIQNDNKMTLEFTENSHYEIIVYQNVNVDSYKDKSNLIDVRFLRLMNGLLSVDLPNVAVTDLTPIALIPTLRYISLTSKNIKPSSLDNLLFSIIDNYGSDRLPAKVIMNVKPTGTYQKPSQNIGVNYIQYPSALNNTPPSNSYKIQLDGKFIKEKSDFMTLSLYQLMDYNADVSAMKAKLVAYNDSGELLYEKNHLKENNTKVGNYNENTKISRVWYTFEFPKDMDILATKFYILLEGDNKNTIQDIQFEIGNEPTEFNSQSASDIDLDNWSAHRPKTGMEAVWVLTNEPAWNSDYYKWEIIINGINYQKVEK